MHGGGRATRDGEGLSVGCHEGSTRIEDVGDHLDSAAAGAEVLDGGRDHDVGVLIFDPGRRDTQPVERDVDGLGDEQGHVPVDAGAGVPAAVLPGAALHTDRVLLAVPEVVIEANGKLAVPVRAVRRELSVEEHDGVPIHAFEPEYDGPVAPLDRHNEVLLVLVGARPVVGQGCVTLWVATRGQHRVVGQVHRLKGRDARPDVEGSGAATVRPPSVERLADQWVARPPLMS